MSKDDRYQDIKSVVEDAAKNIQPGVIAAAVVVLSRLDEAMASGLPRPDGPSEIVDAHCGLVGDVRSLLECGALLLQSIVQSGKLDREKLDQLQDMIDVLNDMTGRFSERMVSIT